MLEPIRITAGEFQNAFGAMSDVALHRPVIITKQGRDHLVLTSAEEYARLMRRDRRVYSIGELPEEIIIALQTTQMDPRHDHLNGLLDEGA